MGRLRAGRIILVAGERSRFFDVADVDDRDARHPAAGIHLRAAAHRMVQAVLGPLRMRLVAARHVLPLHRPARDLHRLRRIADIVDDQDVADEALHFGGDIGVVFVDIKTMHALAVGFHEGHKLGVCPVLDVIDTKAAIGVFLAPTTITALEL